MVAPTVLALGAATMTAGVLTVPATAASSDGCEGGGFSLVNLATGTAVASGATGATVPAAALGERFGVRGLYNQFDVRAADFAVLDYAFTGAANDNDMTGGRFTPVWASKVPDHRGATLTGDVAVSIDGEDLVITRTGPALSMKIQAKDCAQGGIFQMEPEREDGQTTRIVHTLAQSADPALRPFFFDNTNFRERVGQFLGDECTSVTTGPPGQLCVKVSTRTNIGNDFSPAFVARDSAQVAERVDQPACNTATPVTPSVEHCGSQSIWDVASGGRMGFVTGEDAVEVGNPPTDCVQDCQAQNQVRGRLAVLGFPFPVPAGSRLTPATAAGALPVPAPVPAAGSPASTGAPSSTGTPSSAGQVRPSAPRMRSAVAGRPGGRTTATARWRPVAGAVGYQVRAVRVGAHSRTITSDRLSGSARSRTMTLRRGSYRFTVRAINAAGAGAWSTRSNTVRAR
ncbi:fibronectin type III domain-containing protein [Nocardioides sp. P5_C9_2]